MSPALGWIHLPPLLIRYGLMDNSFANFWTWFSSFLAKFLPFYKVECAEDTAELWKTIKNAKNLAKNEEKDACPEIKLTDESSDKS